MTVGIFETVKINPLPLNHFLWKFDRFYSLYEAGIPFLASSLASPKLVFPNSKFPNLSALFLFALSFLLIWANLL